MTTAEGFAPAKINLALHVTGQRPDGYHLLDSLVVFADIGDRLHYVPGPALSLSLSGPFAEGVPADARNLAWQAADACGWSGRIALEKALPHGAGIGGGSADAAAVLRDLDGPAAAAARLGADVAVCLDPRPQRMQGIGDRLRRVAPFPALDLVLANPGHALPTRQVFAALGTKEHPPMTALPGDAARPAVIGWLARQRNDLQPAALACLPELGAVLAALQDAELARMSGSGATCFGVYPDAGSARQAARRIARDHPGWWVRHVVTGGAAGE